MADAPSYPGAPRWAKVFGIVFLVVALLFFVMLFFRAPHRGHGHHTPHFGVSHTPSGMGYG